MQVQSVAVDGLDGSGKASCLHELGIQLSNAGYNVISTAFPQYETHIGMFLKRVQHGEVLLSQEQKMALYCLNRLETVRPIISVLEQLKLQNDLPVVLGFDRFSSSSILTYAFENETVNIEDFEMTYNHMWELDGPFLDGLSIHETNIYIPVLEAEEAIASAQKDGTRASLDLNENVSVQSRAYELYKVAATLDPRIKRISQYVNGKRDSAEKIAKRIFEMDGFVKSENDTPGTIYELNLQAASLDRELVSRIEENMNGEQIMYLLEDFLV